MNLAPSETQALLREGLRDLLAREVPFARVRRVEKSNAADAELWRLLVAQGFLGAPFPQAQGGADGSLVEAGIVVEEVQRRAAIVPVMEVHASLCALQRAARPERAGALVRSVLAGEAVIVPAILEAGDRFGEIETTADAAGRIRGEKRFVDYAAFATHHLVAARSPGGEPGLYLVAGNDPAVKLEPLHPLSRTPQSLVRYDGAAGEALCGAAGVELLIQIGRALAAVQALACMDVALEQTVAYTRVREQFGRPIGTFMAVQHHAANMAMHVESTRFLVYEALDALGQGRASAEQVALAKAAASRSAPEVTMLAHQLHGGHGFIEENDLYFFTLRGRERALAWGTAEECLALAAETVDATHDWL
jgi:alkylation response protein AidB-like acyl-CoA dehydrogenase